jgi:hypothetical protein
MALFIPRLGRELSIGGGIPFSRMQIIRHSRKPGHCQILGAQLGIYAQPGKIFLVQIAA